MRGSLIIRRLSRKAKVFPKLADELPLLARKGIGQSVSSSPIPLKFLPEMFCQNEYPNSIVGQLFLVLAVGKLPKRARFGGDVPPKKWKDTLGGMSFHGCVAMCWFMRFLLVL